MKENKEWACSFEVKQYPGAVYGDTTAHYSFKEFVFMCKIGLGKEQILPDAAIALG